MSKVISANYGSIPHLPNSRLGDGEHYIPHGQSDILQKAARGRTVIVQRKYDGTNVGVIRQGYQIIALQRYGYRADQAPRPQHRLFAAWVKKNEAEFRVALQDGERICGEWLLQAHGTMMRLKSSPFIAFDMFMPDNSRILWGEFSRRASPIFDIAEVLSFGSISAVEIVEGVSRHYDLLNDDEHEGYVYRAETKDTVEFLAKYVKPSKVDGKYLCGNQTFNELRPQDNWLLTASY